MVGKLSSRKVEKLKSVIREESELRKGVLTKSRIAARGAAEISDVIAIREGTSRFGHSFCHSFLFTVAHVAVHPASLSLGSVSQYCTLFFSYEAVASEHSTQTTNFASADAF